MFGNGYKRLLILPTLIILSLAIGCTLRKPAVEKVAPNDKRIHKGMFFEKGMFGSKAKPRTFVFGAASEAEMGWFGSYILHRTNEVDHANIVFTIEESAIVGHLIDPSFPDDPNRWKKIIQIPVRRHFYLERAKDEYGREKNQEVENSSRSHWSARPFMDLDLNGIQVFERGYMPALGAYTGGAYTLSGIEDVEIDQQTGFIAFSAVAMNNYLGTEAQSKVRYNFLAFEHNPKFKRTPYHETVSKYLNVLHIIGKQIEGVSPVLYAGRWDAKKHTALKTKIYLQNFPPEYVDIGVATVEGWNQAFRDAKVIGKNEKLFEPVVENNVKHTFDLRRVSMTWISDRKISESAPLGVGTAISDVRNGEFLWAGVTIWGGALEGYVKSHMPTTVVGANLGKPQMAFLDGLDVKAKTSTESVLPFGLQSMQSANVQSNLQQYFRSIGARYQDLLTAMGSNPNFLVGRSEDQIGFLLPGLDLADGESIKESQIPEVRSGLQKAIDNLNLARVGDISSVMAQDLENEFRNINSQASQFSQTFTREAMRELFGMPELGESLKATALANGVDAEKLTGDLLQPEGAFQFVNSLEEHYVERASKYDLDLNLLNVGPALGKVAAMENVDATKAIRSKVRFLLMHEYGHIIGSGHNHKENIVPEKGTVPEAFRQALASKSNAENGWNNYSSVMGYISPLTMIHMQEKDINPGPHDLLMLRYLYNQEFALFRDGSEKFEFAKVPNDGRIPSEMRGKDGQIWKTSYFPQCNDYEASYDVDPYCNRWDRGSNAVDLVSNYADYLNAAIGTNLYAFTDARDGNPYSIEGRLWMFFLRDLNRIRLFYDEMRQYYSEQIKELSSGPNAQENLMQFSDVCRGKKGVNNAELSTMFTKYPRFKELCAANGVAVERLAQFMTPPGWDYTQIDYARRYSPAGIEGGDAAVNRSRLMGSWLEISTLPIKMPSMMVLTSPYPFRFWGGWMLPNRKYSSEKGRYVYQTLYPTEYTEAIARVAKENLRFDGFGENNKPIMGKSILSLGWMLNRAYYSNDSLKVDSSYLEMLREQTQFEFDLQFLLLDTVENKNNDQRIKKFTGKLYNFRNGKETKLSDVYLLPDGYVIAVPPDNILIYTPKPIRLYSDTGAYTLAFRMDFNDKRGDHLQSHSVKIEFRDLFHRELKKCIDGPDSSTPNGLQYYFNEDSDFEGFAWTKETYQQKEKTDAFFDSIKESFWNYWKNRKMSVESQSEVERFKVAPKPETCQNAMRSLRLILNGAGAINGYYLPYTIDDIEKGMWW